jgi:hypothetical protein
MATITKLALTQINATLAADNAALRAQVASLTLDLEIARADIVAIAEVASALNTMSSSTIDTSTGAGQTAFFAAKRAEKRAAATPTAESDRVVAPAGFWDHKKAQAADRGTAVAKPYQSKPFVRSPAQEAARAAAMASGVTTKVA